MMRSVPDVSLAHLAAATAAAAVAGALNAVAGGGTNVSFPALLWLGLPPVIANATSAVALWPGSLAGAWGYRRSLAGAQARWFWLVAPSVLGGALGAWMLVALPSHAFAALAPWLVLASTLLFAGRLLLTARRQRRAADPLTAPATADGPRAETVALGPLDDAPQRAAHRSLWAALVVQLGIAVYGGYFGAGIGILMLATLGLCGIEDLNVTNGIKNLLAAAINGTAILGFVLARAVDWRIAPVMALGAIAGGWAGAHAAQRLPPLAVRWAIVGIGLLMTVATFRGLR
jgi:uncharacterized membrane protein YfcA